VNLSQAPPVHLRQRRAGNRVSFSAYIKGHGGIRLGTGCKIHADASVDASRSPGVRFGDKVTLNRYAYVQGGNGGVRWATGSKSTTSASSTAPAGVDIGDDTLIGPGVRIISYQHRMHVARRYVRKRSMRVRSASAATVWLGANAVILAGVTIGDGAVVAPVP
jgi:acetyltransferase-like isoleucine patch superfamily enzyme